MRAHTAQIGIPSFTAHGGIGTLAWNINGHVGIEAEFGAHYSDEAFDTTTFSYLFGHRLSYGRTKRFDPYAHVLLGGMHLSSNIDANSVLVPTPHTVPVPSSGRYKASENNFAFALGGGIDITLNRYVLFRPAQIDYVHTQFYTPTFLQSGGVGPSSHQNNFRYAVGFAFNFNDDSVHQ